MARREGLKGETARFSPRPARSTEDPSRVQCEAMTAVNLQDDVALSSLARGLVGSEILKIAGEIRSLCEKGRDICNLTVGDFAPKEFRIPYKLNELIAEALAAGETNYPPVDGVKELRQAVVPFYKDTFNLTYPVESTLIAGRARPVIVAASAPIVLPGGPVVV